MVLSGRTGDPCAILERTGTGHVSLYRPTSPSIFFFNFYLCIYIYIVFFATINESYDRYVFLYVQFQSQKPRPRDTNRSSVIQILSKVIWPIIDSNNYALLSCKFFKKSQTRFFSLFSLGFDKYLILEDR